MSGALIQVNGGTLNFESNTVVLGNRATERPGAVLITGNACAIIVLGNTLRASGRHSPLVCNWSGLTATGGANTFPGGAGAVSESGAYYHRMRSQLATIRNRLHDLVGLAWHIARVLTKA